MASSDYGKAEMIKWINLNYRPNETCLDVGACDGKWSDLLGGYLKMDAVEIFGPNISEHELAKKYNNVFCGSILNFEYKWYDLIIFGDVLEHMSVQDAQIVLKYASTRCRDFLIGIPFLYAEEELYGNPWERHIQDDLTPELFQERFTDTELLLDTGENYAYYHKRR